MTPKVRQLLYSLGLIATGALTLLSVFRIIDPNTSSTVSAAVSALLSVFGVGAAGTAAVTVGRQINRGMYAPKSEQPAVEAASALEAVTRQYNDLLSQVTAGMEQVHQTAAALGTVAQPIINELDSLAAAAIRAASNPDGNR